jgi:hypothetical protein
MPVVSELAGREVFCLGCGSHFVIPDLSQQPSEQFAVKVITFKPDDSPYTAVE